MVIEGEALLNDGAAIVFFNVFLKLTTTEVGLSGKVFCVSKLRVLQKEEILTTEAPLKGSKFANDK